MTTQAEPTEFQPPYMAWSTFENIIDQLAAVGLPAQIDRSVLSSRSGGDQSQFLRASRSFKLIDAEGRPTERLRTMISQPERRQEILRQILEENYPDALALGTDATPQQLTDEFRKFGIEGDTVRKAIAFYINAAKQAEIPLSPHFQATRPGAGGRRRRTTTARRQTSTNGSDSETPKTPTPAMHPAILTLVNALPRFGDDPTAKPAFPTKDREAWFEYARATFNLIYALPDDGGTPDVE